MNPLKQLFAQTEVYEPGTRIPCQLYYFLLTPFFTWVFFNPSVWYKLKNLIKSDVLNNGTGAVIIFIIDGSFIPGYGSAGSGWAHLFCYFTMVIMPFYSARKY